ncbi:M23 family metallopeptidase [Leptospira santarosai]|nr:M23 family metallopeptidase [Leptospira santarosai]EMJ50863.1 peptidase, M23 family [Leptospira santarosai str. HAI1349]EMM84935.1 peptidase, M23 family [Leptospira santarosai str. 2000027870]EMO14310.1 peptidase, M23 family [Leptospira santarosai str. CBC523]EMO24447.1 peptidase, M23 family [Leptospira santarosai str. HAI134]EMO33039.1 peptidase, M23 family [Leptospira santarosai str. HAI821]
MKFPISKIFFLVLAVVSCLETVKAKEDGRVGNGSRPSQRQIETSSRESLSFEEANEFFTKHPKYISDGFDFPVGAPNAKGYYDLQPFSKNFHLGEDWNAVGRNDYGDPVYAVSNGVVKFAGEEGPGWGNVLILTHKLPDGRWINSLYAHLSKIGVSTGDKIKKGKQIGRIGDANRLYGPHLHFEMRENFFLPTGPGYGKDTKGYLSPKEFIRKHRRLKKRT